MKSEYGVRAFKAILEDKGFEPTTDFLLQEYRAILYGLAGTGGLGKATEGKENLEVNNGEVTRAKGHAEKLGNDFWMMRLEVRRDTAGLTRDTSPDSVLLFRPPAIDRPHLAPDESSRCPGAIVIPLDELTPGHLADALSWDEKGVQKRCKEMPTAVRQLVWARSHAGRKFRQEVLAAYGTECAFCDLPYTDILEAAHIMPWSKAKEHQRIDVRNGVLLCPNCHSLFDRDLLRLSRDFSLTSRLDDWSHRKDMRLPPVEKRPNPDWIEARNKP